MRRNPREGYSLIEMLVALALLGIVVVGLIPLFARSIKSNESAEETSDLVRAAQLQMEGLVQLPFNDPQITVASGDHSTTTVAIDPAVAYKMVNETTNPYLRNHPVDSEVTIRHFNIAAIDDGEICGQSIPGVCASDALDAGMAQSLVHFKQIALSVDRPNYSFGLPIGRANIQMIKAN